VPLVVLASGCECLLSAEEIHTAARKGAMEINLETPERVNGGVV